MFASNKSIPHQIHSPAPATTNGAKMRMRNAQVSSRVLSGVKSVAVHPGEGGGWLSGFGLDQ